MQYDLNEWDESRLGSNCYEMYHNHDYINLYYDSKPDTWIAKPPLLNWLVIASQKVFGFNEISLRLPNYIAAIILLIVFIRMIIKYDNHDTALLTSLILLSTKTILGWHSALTGDYDILLTLFLVVSAYYFQLYCDTKSANNLYLSSVFTGLAFYTKGTAAFIFIPGYILYLLTRRELTSVIKSKTFIISVCILVTIVGSWLLLLTVKGNQFDCSFYGSKNAISTLFLDDTIRRIADNSFQDKTTQSPFFVFIAMDVRLNMWNYVFYIAAIVLIVKLYKSGLINLGEVLAEKANRLIIFSICLISPLFLILTFSKTQHDWYLIPSFIFTAYLIASFIVTVAHKYKQIYYACFLLLVFTTSRHAYYLHEQPTTLHNTLNLQNPLLKSTKEIITLNMPRQHIFLYLQWMHITPIKLSSTKELQTQKGKLLLLNNEQLREISAPDIHILQSFDEFKIARIN